MPPRWAAWCVRRHARQRRHACPPACTRRACDARRSRSTRGPLSRLRCRLRGSHRLRLRGSTGARQSDRSPSTRWKRHRSSAPKGHLGARVSPGRQHRVGLDYFNASYAFDARLTSHTGGAPGSGPACRAAAARFVRHAARRAAGPWGRFAISASWIERSGEMPLSLCVASPRLAPVRFKALLPDAWATHPPRRWREKPFDAMELGTNLQA